MNEGGKTMNEPYTIDPEITEAERDKIVPPGWVGLLDLKLGTQPGLVLSWIQAAMFLRLGPRRTRQILSANRNPAVADRSNWVRFPGSVEGCIQDEIVLIPADKPGDRWRLSSADVQTGQDGAKRDIIFLRRGGTVRSITPAQPTP